MSKFVTILCFLSIFSTSAFAISNKNLRIKSQFTQGLWSKGLVAQSTIDDQNYTQYLNYVDQFEQKFVQNDIKLTQELKKALNAIK
jgi:hypothetical protein